MLKSSLIVATAATGMLVSGAAFAQSPQGPEPYHAPDPSYTPHKVVSSVTYNKDGKVVSKDEASEQAK